MSSKGKQQMVSSLGRDFAAALEGSIAAGKDAAVQAAEKAARESEEARDDALFAARTAMDEVKVVRKGRAELASMLKEHAQEVRDVVGRAVLVCSWLAAAAVLPWLVWLGTLLW